MQKRIGEFLVDRGLLTLTQVDQILSYSGRTGTRFGQAALELKLITREQLIEVFGPSYEVPFFHLQAAYFPETTKNLMTVDEILKFGALPLGFKTELKLLGKKKKIINIGVLDPINETQKAGIKDTVLKRFQSEMTSTTEEVELKYFLILADQFISILRSHYQVSDEQLKNKPTSQLNSILSMFLERI